jgi:uncharacterized delta-60 repeat protein
MAQFQPLFLNTGSIKAASGSTIVDYMHFPVTSSLISSSYTTLLPDPYLFSTMSANIANDVNTTSSSLFQFRVPNRQEQYFYAHNSIVGVTTSATTTGVRIGLQKQNLADGIANIKVSSTLTAHTIACIGSFSGTTFALPGSMVATNTVYPCFVKGLYTNTTSSVELRNTILLQPETNNTVTAITSSVSYNKFIGYNSSLLDTSFNSGTGFNDNVYATNIQTDGKILVGGSFTSYNGTTQNRITRLNPDGTRDTSFNIGTGFNDINTTPISIAIQTDGKIVVGGSIKSYNGTTQEYITRINSDGSRDTSFNIGAGFIDIVFSVAIQTDGKILAGGLFTSYSGSTQNRITRLNTNGTRDTSFNIGTGFDTIVYSIAIQTDGKILVGGGFTTYSGSTQNRITRINPDGTRDTSFNIGTGFNNNVRAINVQQDGKIIAAGDFTSYSGSTQNCITRINPDGTRDTSFNIGTGFVVPGTGVGTINIQSDGKIIAGGFFTAYSGSEQNRITRIDTDGTRDTSFYTGQGLSAGFSFGVRATSIQSDGKIIVGGDFTFYNGIPQQNYILRLLSTINTNKESIPLYFSTGSLAHITGGHTITSSFLPVTSSQWFSQSLATNVANTGNAAYATVFNLTGLTNGQTCIANLYIIGSSAAAATGFRMRVITGSQYRGTLYTPTSTTAPAIQNSAGDNNITSIAAGTWPTVNVKYLVSGEYTFVKGATDPQVQILSENNGTAVTAFSGSVIFYRAIN